MFPFFDLVRVWNPQLQREHTDWSPNLFCPPQLWIFYMHILHFLNLSLVCSNLENFTCTHHTFSTFPFSIRSNCPPLYDDSGLICFDAKHDLSEELTCGKETNWNFPAIIAIDLIWRAKPWLADTVVTFVTSFLSKWIQANPLIGLFTHSTDRQTLNIEKLLTL